MFFAQNLKYLREENKMSQQELSDAFGWSRDVVDMLEKGSRKPDIEMLVRLAEHFGVTLDELVLKELKPPLPLYASNIKYLRKRQEITQEDMAVFLGFSGKSSLCAVETGKSGISIENLEKLADFFGVTLDQMVKHDLSKEGV